MCLSRRGIILSWIDGIKYGNLKENHRCLQSRLKEEQLNDFMHFMKHPVSLHTAAWKNRRNKISGLKNLRSPFKFQQIHNLELLIT